MTDYTELVKALRYCSTTKGMVYCNVNCKYGWEERSGGCKDILMTDAAAAIEDLQAQLPKQGEWIEDRTEIVCSKCHARFSDEIIFMNRNMENEALKYCPNCGAKMEVQDG